MNRTALKAYAPQARKDFLEAVRERAAFYGITEKKIEEMTVKGDTVVIRGKEYPKAIATKRASLETRIKDQGYQQTIEALAYTWFNRLVALRFMEIHGYLDHGYRVLSHPENKAFPEILEHAEHLELPSLNQEKVIDLKLAGNKENELYRLILLAQCNALHEAMPFLFERIDDETELVLPENLLNSDSLIRKLVEGIDESDWDKVEIIGWLYQYYLSEKKDEVIGSVVASENIPAATQLFTPNWIVRYLVQNTLGRQWLATYPDSPIRAEMEYYIEPAEQEPEVAKQLREITPESLNPEEITFLDPACGSGHILVEAYDLFQAIYQERGYRSRDIPTLILQKNLHGFEIDDRAAQLAKFALLMKARANDRGILEKKAQPNILCFVESKDCDAASLTAALNSNIKGIGKAAIEESLVEELVKLFEHAKTFGSLIQIPEDLPARLQGLEDRLQQMEGGGDLRWLEVQRLQPLVRQAKALAAKYDAVVANPPYMGSKYLNPLLKKYLKEHYLGFEKDLFSTFIIRDILFAKKDGHLGFMSPFVWMFISSFEKLRSIILDKQAITSLIQPEYHSFFESAYVPICAFTVANFNLKTKASFVKLTDFYGEELQIQKLKEAIRNKSCGWFYEAKQDDFKKIPGSPIAYWLTKKSFLNFDILPPLNNFYEFKQGLATGDNNTFLRYWHECSIKNIGFDMLSATEADLSKKKWFPCNKGGESRKWYGNNYFVINWKDNGKEIKAHNGSVIRNPSYYFREGATWGSLTVSSLTMRYSPNGFIFESKGAVAFEKTTESLILLIAFANSKVMDHFLQVLSPTLDYSQGPVGRVPLNQNYPNQTIINAQKAIQVCVQFWNLFEISWDFGSPPLLLKECKEFTISKSVQSWNRFWENTHKLMKNIEEENNRIFIEAYGLQDELTPEVPDDQITLYRPNREEDIKRLLSYAIGCMMGRYSLDKEGLIYAHSGNEGFDPTQYKTFPADDDGIIPLLNTDWGIGDDATERFVQFIASAWDKANLEENLRFVAESLGAPKDEPAREVIRKYFSTGFYKHHLQTYKRRPIYWLFTSGKQKAFQCLVYLHRYNEGTLARMRTEYLIPLLGRATARIEQLEADKLKSSSTSQRKKLQKEQDDLRKQHTELMTFDEKLKNYADQRIQIDLDDGVKVNYAKFADILAEVKAVTGGSEE